MPWLYLAQSALVNLLTPINQHFKLAYHCTDRWMKTLNISVASEQKQRFLAKSTIGENLVAEMGGLHKET